MVTDPLIPGQITTSTLNNTTLTMEWEKSVDPHAPQDEHVVLSYEWAFMIQRQGAIHREQLTVWRLLHHVHLDDIQTSNLSSDMVAIIFFFPIDILIIWTKKASE